MTTREELQRQGMEEESAIGRTRVRHEERTAIRRHDLHRRLLGGVEPSSMIAVR
jgi:hypothetical protein